MFTLCFGAPFEKIVSEKGNLTQEKFCMACCAVKRTFPLSCEYPKAFYYKLFLCLLYFIGLMYIFNFVIGKLHSSAKTTQVEQKNNQICQSADPKDICTRPWRKVKAFSLPKKSKKERNVRLQLVSLSPLKHPDSEIRGHRAFCSRVFKWYPYTYIYSTYYIE